MRDDDTMRDDTENPDLHAEDSAVTVDPPAKKKAKKVEEADEKVEPRTFLVNTGRAPLNGRSGPGKEHPVLTTIQPGDKVSVEEVDGDWARTSDGFWLNLSYLVEEK